jgi:hypothetical protein
MVGGDSGDFDGESGCRKADSGVSIYGNNGSAGGTAKPGGIVGAQLVRNGDGSRLRLARDVDELREACGPMRPMRTWRLLAEEAPEERLQSRTQHKGTERQSDAHETTGGKIGHAHPTSKLALGPYGRGKPSSSAWKRCRRQGRLIRL